MENIGIGKLAIKLAIAEEQDVQSLTEEIGKLGYVVYRGRAGSMDAKNIFASVETAAMRQDLIRENYREEHALYHGIMEAFSGYCRGQVDLGNVLRSTGLVYTIVRGPLVHGVKGSGDWIAVVMYGLIGSPRQGFEHEAIGMGIQPI